MTTNLADPLWVLSATIWAEARNQGHDGMFAVGCVVRNRAQNGRWWGNSIVSVCLEPFQFSCWNTGQGSQRTRMMAVTTADPQFVIAQTIAAQIIAGQGDDITHNSDSYYAVTIGAPAWCTRASFCIQIGAHRFYRVELPAVGTVTPAAPFGKPQSPCISATTEDLNASELKRIKQP